ncbi:MAG: hypothetical protein Q9164_006302 [Protoblastenia rupestris]
MQQRHQKKQQETPKISLKSPMTRRTTRKTTRKRINITRPLTKEEIQRDVEIIDRIDKTCSEERRFLKETEEGDDSSVLVISGTGPEIWPPEDVEAIATDTPIVPRREATVLVEFIMRRAASPKLPEPTTAPAIAN